MKLAEFIEGKLKEPDMSVALLGAIIGLSVTSIYKHRRKMMMPSISTAKRIYNIYDIVIEPYSKEALGGIDDAQVG